MRHYYVPKSSLEEGDNSEKHKRCTKPRNKKPKLCTKPHKLKQKPRDDKLKQKPCDATLLQGTKLKL